MKHTILFTALILICLSGFGQMPDWKKSIYIGSAITVGGAGIGVGGGYALAVGVPLFIDDDEGKTLVGTGLVVVGTVLSVVGVVGVVVGPIIIARAVKERNREKEDVSLSFVPIRSKLPDKYQCSLNNKKFASLCFTF